MKFSIFALTGLAALAAAQESTGSSPTATASLSPEASCAANCSPSDVCCKAKCFKVPCPNAAMANDTTACAARCPQGSGTPADTEAYAKCEQSCYSSLFFPATAASAAAAATGSSGSDVTTLTGSGSSATATSGSGSSGSSSGSGSGSSSGSSSSSASVPKSTGAASQLSIELGASAAGLLGVVVAAFAL